MISTRAETQSASFTFMNIVDLRQTSVRQIEPLLEEESLHWRDELHWDYRGALELIKRFLEARALSGCVAYENGTAAGYTFYVMEEQKGLIGGLYVSPQFDQTAIARRLLEEMLYGMRTLPNLYAQESLVSDVTFVTPMGESHGEDQHVAYDSIYRLRRMSGGKDEREMEETRQIVAVDHKPVAQDLKLAAP